MAETIQMGLTQKEHISGEIYRLNIFFGYQPTQPIHQQSSKDIIFFGFLSSDWNIDCDRVQVG